jgi:hypothetical protein
LVTGCATTPPASNNEWHTVELGLCEDYPEESRSLEAAREDLKAAQRAGARVLRIAFGWDAMEPERGRYDWVFWDEYVRIAVDEFGIRLIPYVCYTPRWAATDDGDDFWRSPPRDAEDFERFMTALVSRYKHAIATWELWNEPDNRAYWLGTREQFAALVRAGSKGVRSADAKATIVLGGIATETDFLEELFRMDRIAPAVDVVNLHSYFETWHPDSIETLPDYVERASEIVREYGESEPLWMAETGYSSVGGRRVVSEVYQARYRGEHTADAQATALARTCVLAFATGELPLVAWYRINDLPTDETVIGDDNNRHLGIRTVSGKEKDAFTTLTMLNRWFQQPYRILRPSVRTLPATDSSAEVRAFALRDGRQIVAAWLGMPENTSHHSGHSAASEPQNDTRRATIRVSMPKSRTAAVHVSTALGTPLDADRATWRHIRGATELDLKLRGGELIFCELQP